MIPLYIERIGAIKMFIDLFDLAGAKCTSTLYDIPGRCALAIRFDWTCSRVEELERQEREHAMGLLLGCPQEPLSKKDEWILRKWRQTATWEGYRDSFGYDGGYTIYLEINGSISQSSQSLRNLKDALGHYYKGDTLGEWIQKAEECERVKNQHDKELKFLKSHVGDAVKAKKALKDFATLLTYQNCEVFKKALGCSAKQLEDNKELAEIVVLMNRIKGYTEQSAKIVDAYQSVLQTLSKYQQRDVIPSKWEIKYLLDQ